MMSAERTIDINAKPEFLTLDQIRAREEDIEDWHLRNDMVKDVRIEAFRGFLSLAVSFKSGKQGGGGGHRNEGNIGIMLKWLMRLWDVDGDTGDVLGAISGTPIRVLDKDDWGGSIAEGTYLGHFMEDRFIKVSALVMAGIKTEGGAE